MGFLDNLEAYMDQAERSGHTCKFEKVANGMVRCSTCVAQSETKPTS